MLREGALVIQKLLRQRVQCGDGYCARFEKVLAVADVLAVLDPSTASKDSVARASLQTLFELYPDLATEMPSALQWRHDSLHSLS